MKVQKKKKKRPLFLWWGDSAIQNQGRGGLWLLPWGKMMVVLKEFDQI
jgi:hypothetical protein